MKNRNNPKYFQEKIVTGAYSYRGYDIWKNAALNLWIINGLQIEGFSTLKEAKTHVDRVLKYGIKNKKPACLKPNSDSSNSRPLK